MTTTPAIDLHTHTDCSDGTDTPGELIEKAAAQGLSAVAITDHDTTIGWDEARVAGDRHGIAVVRGVEVSTRNEGRGQHLLGYGFDPRDPAVIAMLARNIASREARLDEHVRLLAGLNKPIDKQAVLALVKEGSSLGKPHTAQALLDAKHVTDTDQAHRELLGNGCPAYVERDVVDIAEAIQTIKAAGGVTVIAHPRGRKSAVTEERFAQLAEIGLDGIEVDHLEHDRATQAELRGIAVNLGLIWTGSSDYHGTRKENRLGHHTTQPEQYERLLSLVRA